MLDEKDRAIISILQYDGRTPFTKIAEELNIAEGSVRRRVQTSNRFQETPDRWYCTTWGNGLERSRDYRDQRTD